MLLFVQIMAVITLSDSTHDVVHSFILLQLAHNCFHDCSQHGLPHSLRHPARTELSRMPAEQAKQG